MEPAREGATAVLSASDIAEIATECSISSDETLGVLNGILDGEPSAVYEQLVQLGVRTATTDANASHVAFTAARVLVQRAVQTQKVSESVKSDFLAHILNSDVPLEQRVVAMKCVAFSVNTTAPRGDFWTELWKCATSTLNDPNADPKLCILFCQLISQTTPYIGDSTLRTLLTLIIDGLQTCVTRTEHEALSVTAIDALSRTIAHAHSRDGALLQQSLVVPTVLNVAVRASTIVTTAVFKLLFEILESNKGFMLPAHRDGIVSKVALVIGSDRFEKEARHSAITFINNFAQFDEMNFKKNKDWITAHAAQMFEYVQRQPEPDDDWKTTYDETSECVDDVDIAATSLDQLCVNVCGKILGPLMISFVHDNVNAPQWRKRCAALTVLMYSMEGCRKQCTKDMDTIMKKILVPRMADEHPAVRFNAIRCLAQFIVDIASPIEIKRKIAFVLPSLCAVAVSDPIPRLQTIAIVTLDNYFDHNVDEGTYDAVADFAVECLPTIVSCTNNAQHPFFFFYSLVALATVTLVCGKRVLQHKDILSQLIKKNLERWSTTDGRTRCRIIESATLFASSAGLNEFGEENAHALCNTLLKLQRDFVKPSDEFVPYLMRGWSNMLDCMKGRVMPFLREAFPFILNMFGLQIELKGGFEEAAEAQQTHITETINVKDVAGAVVLYLMKALRANLRQYFTQLTDLCVSNLAFGYASNIVTNAAEILGVMGSVLVDDMPQKELCESFAQKVAEPLADVMRNGIYSTEVAEAFTAVARAARPETLDEALVPLLFEATRNVLTDMLTPDDGNGSDSDDDGESSVDTAAKAEAATARFDLAMETLKAAGAMLPKSQVFAKAFTVDILGLVGPLLEVQQTPLHHRAGLFVLACLVDNDPASATQHLSNIAESVVFFASGESTDEHVLHCAFYIAGKLALLIAAAVQSNTDESALMFARTMVAAAVKYLSSEASANSRSTAINVMACVFRIADVFPAVFTTAPEDAAAVFALCVAPLQPSAEDGDEVEERWIYECLKRWSADSSSVLQLAAPETRRRLLEPLQFFVS